jgi:hypothetical protein
LGPKHLSTDEYQLMLMEAREDAELGADAFNTETFGEEVVSAGWSFEENVTANARLASRQKGKQGANKMAVCFRSAGAAGGC